MKPQYIDLNHGRLNLYQENIELLKGNAFTVWGINQRDYFKHFHKNNDKTYLNYNYFKLFSNRITNLVLGKDFYVKTENEEVTKWLNDWIKETKYIKVQKKKLKLGTVLGDSPTKIVTRLDDDGKAQVYVDYLDPWMWFPIVNQWNVNIIEGHAVLYTKKIEKDTYYLVEAHYPKYIEYQAFYEKGKDWEPTDLSIFNDLLQGVELDANNRIETGSEYPTVVVYQNETDENPPFGTSDFDPAVKSLIYGINDTLTGIHATNGMTRDPLYSLPNGTIKSIMDARNIGKSKKTDGSIKVTNPYKDFTNDVNSAISGGTDTKNLDILFTRELLSDLLYKSRAIEKSVDGQGIDVVQHNPQMQNSFTEVDYLKGLLFETTEMSPALIDAKFQSGTLSGTALRNLAIATLKKASEKAKELAQSIRQELYIVQELAINATDSEFPTDKALHVTVEISDGLGTDPQDEIQWVSMAMKLGLINRQDAIALLRDLNSDEAKLKADELQIESDKAKQEQMQLAQNQVDFGSQQNNDNSAQRSTA